MKAGALFFVIAILLASIPNYGHGQSACDQILPTILAKNGFSITLPTDQQVTISARMFDSGSFDNMTPNDSLRFSFSKDPADSLRTYVCSHLGQINTKVWVTDLAGNQHGINTFFILQDNLDACFIPNSDCAPILWADNGLITNLSESGTLSLTISQLEKFFIPNCVPDSMQFAFSDNLADTLQEFTCYNLGQQFIHLWGAGTNGNFSFVSTPVFVQDNMEFCDGMPSPGCIPIPIIKNGLLINTLPNQVVSIHAQKFNLNSYSPCTPNETLHFSFSNDISDTLRHFSAIDVGNENLKIWMTDGEGNQNYIATFLNVQFNPDVTIQCCDIPIEALEVIQPPCHGDLGFLTIGIESDFPPYNYIWSTGSTFITQDTQLSLSVPIGPIELTVTDNNDCTGTWATEIVEPPLLSLIEIDSTHPPCIDLDIGSINFEIVGGIPIMDSLYNIHTLWNSQNFLANSVNFQDLAPGTYCFEVSDANDCTIERCFTLEYLREYDLKKDSTNVLCHGDSTGNIGINVEMEFGLPAQPYTFEWSGDHPINNQNDDTFTSLVSNLFAGNYTLTMTDNEGCTVVVSTNIEEPLPLAPQVDLIAGPPCFGDQAIVTVSEVFGGNSAFFQYWLGDNVPKSVGDTTMVFAGLHDIFVKEIASGCEWDSTIMIQEPPPLSIDSLESLPETCPGLANGALRFRISGGAISPQGDYNIEISNLGIFQAELIDLTNLPSGSYHIVVTDANGCTAEDNIDVGLEKLLTINADITNVQCFGENSGEIFIEPASIGSPPTFPFSFEWDGTPTPPPAQNEVGSSTLPNLFPGNYFVTATDADGCTVTGFYNITEPTALIASFESIVEPSCEDISNGEASVLVEGGGTSPYNFLWNTSPPQTTATAMDLEAGLVQVTVSDNNNCDLVLDTLLNAGDPPIIELLGQTDETCEPGGDGSATVTATLGTGPYTYEWSTDPVQQDSMAINLSQGYYEVTVTDMAGCTGASGIEIEMESRPIISQLENDTLLCFGDKNGIVEVSASSDSPPLEYLWSNGMTTERIEDLSAGIYYVTVTDQKPCTITDSVLVVPTSRLLPHIPKPTPPDCFGENIFVTVDSVSGGNGAPYLFSIDNSPYHETGDMVEADPGMLDVSIIDSEGCTMDTTILAEAPEEIIISLDEEDIDLCDPIPLKLFINDIDRIVEALTVWTILEGEEEVLSCLNCLEPIFYPGSQIIYRFRVEITDSLGCTVSKTFKIDKLQFPDLFTPNGDNVNDLFEIKACDNLANFENELTVFNQWGSIVYQTENYENNWDGTWKNKPLPEASYYYSFRIKIAGRVLEKTGRIAILR